MKGQNHNKKTLLEIDTWNIHLVYKARGQKKQCPFYKNKKMLKLK